MELAVVRFQHFVADTENTSCAFHDIRDNVKFTRHCSQKCGGLFRSGKTASHKFGCYSTDSNVFFDLLDEFLGDDVNVELSKLFLDFFSLRF